jgi:hypothetical protein
MRRTQQTHGEQKQAPCETCGTIFPKKRFDQRYCSKPCKVRGDVLAKPRWADSPYREKANERRKLRYHLNRDAETQRHRDDRAANPEKYRAADHAKYLRRKPQVADAVKAYRAAHPDMRKREYRKRKEKLPWTFLVASAKKRSREGTIEFDLTREWAESIWTGRCAISGIEFERGTTGHYPRSPSVDRIDPAKGYTQANCRFVLFAVNSLKGAGTDAEMLEIAKAIVSAFS